MEFWLVCLGIVAVSYTHLDVYKRQVFVLRAGHIDLTVGSNTAMSAMLVALVLKSTNNICLALIVALIFGVAVGVINGLLVTRLGLPAFLATLGMMQVIRGAAMWITNTAAVPISNTVFNTIFGTGFVGPISCLLYTSRCV